MALFPCAVGSHRYAGPQQSAYLGVANGGLSARSKLRLCRQHFDDLLDYVTVALMLVAIGDQTHAELDEERDTCLNHPDLVGDYRCFATMYPLKAEARVYYGRLCQDDADAFRRVGQIELS